MLVDDIEHVKGFEYWFIKIIAIIIVAGLSLYFSTTLIVANSLIDSGISTSAKLLEYKTSIIDKAHNYYYLIYYDTYSEFIEVYSNDYQINSNISVIYDKKNPKLVWLGNKDMNAWDLYCLNTNLVRDGAKLIVLLMACIILFKPRKNPRKSVLTFRSKS